jgi:hypothetical protein
VLGGTAGPARRRALKMQYAHKVAGPGAFARRVTGAGQPLAPSAGSRTNTGIWRVVRVWYSA